MSDAAARDAEARREAQRCFDRPLLLEAGAGTGKTAVLVARIVAWSLGRGWERAEARLAETGLRSDAENVASEVLRGVVAITFTEAAAAEMGRRVGEALLDVRRGEQPVGVDADCLPEPGRARPRAEALIGALDQLTARTFHSWCRRLLQAHPFDAGLSPVLEVDVDGQRRAEVAREVLEARLPEAFADPPEPDFATLVQEGYGPGNLETALLDLLGEGVLPEDLAHDPLSPDAVGRFADELARRLAEFVSLDAGRLAALGGAARTVSALGSGLIELHAALSVSPPKAADDLADVARVVGEQIGATGCSDLRRYAQGGFGAKATKSLGDDAEPLKRATTRLVPMLSHALKLNPSVFAAARRVLHGLLEETEARLRAAGVESFGGLLRRTRDLLATRDGVARRERARIELLLVDEFQDTDPFQCDILEALALRGAAEERPSLFVVGDPKQSIYGWRSADLRAYEEFRERLESAGGRRLPLVCNFRSAPPILAEVERIVQPIMREEPGLQPAFEPLLPSEQTRDLPGFDGEGRAPVEHWLVAEVEDGALAADTTALQASQLEAGAVAADIEQLRERGLALGRVALLFRTTGDFPIYLGALRERGIPFVVERETEHGQRREILDASAIVRCVLDRHDQVALAAALRSPAIGVPDAALVPLWKASLPACVARLGGADPQALTKALDAVAQARRELPKGVPALERLGAFGDALSDFLRALHELRRLQRETTPDRFVEALRARIPLEPLEAVRHLGAYRVANLERFFRDLVQALDESAGSAAAVSGYLRRAGSLDREHREGRARALDDDAVQVMTVHGAKGLDFDHVYLLQTHKGLRGGGDTGKTRVLRRGERLELELLGVPSPGVFDVWEDQAEVEKAEAIRLLYVALTRAKHRLVLSGRRLPDGSSRKAPRDATVRLFGHRRLDADRAAGLIGDDPRVRDEHDVLWCRARPVLGTRPPSIQAVEPVPVSLLRADEGTLDEHRSEARARQARRFVRAASEQDEFREEDVRRASGESETSRDRKVALAAGTAVHAVLETTPMRQLRDDWRAVADHALRDEPSREIGQRVRDVLERFVSGPLLGQLEALGPEVIARELPVLLEPAAGPLSETAPPVGCWSGAIDLLYRDPETRALVVADYKTDAVEIGDLDERARAYAAQGAVYTAAVQAALGLRERPRFELWFLHAGRVVTVPPPEPA